VENKTVEMVVKDLLLADNQKKKKKVLVSNSVTFFVICRGSFTLDIVNSKLVG